jgi:hypothetical protein
MEDQKESVEEFDYESLWGKQEAKSEKKLVEELPKGAPRKGIKGHYIKRKGHVGRQQLKNSWNNFYKSPEGRDIVND